jgi:hypothetical protein
LTQACLNSPFTYGQVEEEVLNYVTKRIPDRRVGVLGEISESCGSYGGTWPDFPRWNFIAGSSVHADARWVVSFLAHRTPLIDFLPWNLDFYPEGCQD